MCLKKIFANLALMLVGSFAWAGSWNYDFRGDMTSTTYNDAAKTASSGQDNYKFNLQTLKVDGKGEIEKSIKYRLRFRFDKAVSITSRDSTSDMVDLAFVSHSPTENLWLTVGKFGSDLGGFDNVASGANKYFETLYYDSITKYYTGAKVTYMLDDHEFNIHTANLDSDSTGTGGKFNQGRTYLAAVFKGSFLEKSLLPMLTYHTSNPQGSGDKKNTHIAFGVKYQQPAFYAMADYLMSTKKDDTTVGKEDTMNTVVLEAQYKDWIIMPKFKGELTNAKTFPAAVESKVATTTLSLALEYQPEKDQEFRYHVAYTTRNTKPESSDARVTNTLLAGMRLSADFLK